jgi:hypothetical protein
MERLNALAQLPPYMAWELRRVAQAFMRRFGKTGLLICLCMGLVAVSGWIRYAQGVALLAAQKELQAPTGPVLDLKADVSDANGRARLAAFEQVLLPYEDIPDAIRSLFEAARREGLTLSKGEYRPQADVQGGFLRYRMALPVKGDADAIRRFMLSVLDTQKTLGLESVQFKRKGIASREVEARIQWTLFARLPMHGAASIRRVEP